MALDKTFKADTKVTRNQKICELRYTKDMSIIKLADYFGITKQRVQQILERDLRDYIDARKKLSTGTS
jgi:predicted DNA-binding protein YlxM (UPF0122 family)